MNDVFRKFAHKASILVGSSRVFVAALVLVLSWLLTGPIFNFSITWQLFINTFTTITTFLIVFIIQNTQNRETKATQLKLDELIKSIKGARNKLVDLEDLSDEELDKLQAEFVRLRQKSDDGKQDP